MKALKYFWSKLLMPLMAFIIIGTMVYLSVDLVTDSTYYWVAFFGFLFFMFNELEDKSMKNAWEGNHPWLNTAHSWRNKWKLDSAGYLLPYKKKWYHFGVKPKHEERFIYSSTILVWLTDGEHLFQFLKKRAIEVGFLMISWQFAVAWIIGVALFSFIKEKWLRSIN